MSLDRTHDGKLADPEISARLCPVVARFDANGAGAIDLGELPTISSGVSDPGPTSQPTPPGLGETRSLAQAWVASAGDRLCAGVR